MRLDYATKWLHIKSHRGIYPLSFPHRSASKLSVLEIKRPRSEIDDPVMGLEQLGPEKSGNWPGFASFVFRKQPPEIGNPNRFAKHIDRSHRKPANARDIDLVLLAMNPG